MGGGRAGGCSMAPASASSSLPALPLAVAVPLDGVALEWLLLEVGLSSELRGLSLRLRLWLPLLEFRLLLPCPSLDRPELLRLRLPPLGLSISATSSADSPSPSPSLSPSLNSSASSPLLSLLDVAPPPLMAMATSSLRHRSSAAGPMREGERARVRWDWIERALRGGAPAAAAAATIGGSEMGARCGVPCGDGAAEPEGRPASGEGGRGVGHSVTNPYYIATDATCSSSGQSFTSP